MASEVYWISVNDKEMTVEWYYVYRQDYSDSRLRFNETLYGSSIAYNDGTTHPASALPFVVSDVTVVNGIEDEWTGSSTSYVVSSDGGVYLTTLRKTKTFH